MSLGAKILAAAAILCMVLWIVFITLGVQPLSATPPAGVVYGEGEDFFADAAVFRKPRNDTFLLVYLPHARPAHRWVSVDFGNTALAFTVPPRSIGSLKYRLKRDEQKDLPIGAKGTEKDWYWHFTEQGAALSGDGFSFRINNIRR